jgi:hypothetical protein
VSRPGVTSLTPEAHGSPGSFTQTAAHVNPTSTSVRAIRAGIHPIRASVIRRIISEPVNTLASRAAVSPLYKASTFTRQKVLNCLCQHQEKPQADGPDPIAATFPGHIRLPQVGGDCRCSGKRHPRLSVRPSCDARQDSLGGPS